MPNYFTEAESNIQHTFDNITIAFSQLVINPPPLQASTDSEPVCYEQLLVQASKNLILFNLKVTAVRCSQCTCTLAVSTPSNLLQLAVVARDECIAERRAAELRLQCCLKQLEMYQKDFMQACKYVDEAMKGIHVIQAFVEAERGH
jgi:hypothetical protein